MFQVCRDDGISGFNTVSVNDDRDNDDDDEGDDDDESEVNEMMR